jgi:hypothetical protein
MADQETLEEVKVSEYKGSAVISLPTGWGKGMTFGLKKAEAILLYLEDIKKFVEDNKKDEN